MAIATWKTGAYKMNATEQANRLHQLPGERKLKFRQKFARFFHFISILCFRIFVNQSWHSKKKLVEYEGRKRAEDDCKANGCEPIYYHIYMYLVYGWISYSAKVASFNEWTRKRRRNNVRIRNGLWSAFSTQHFNHFDWARIKYLRC